MDTLLSVGLLALFGAVVLMIVKWRRHPRATTTRYVAPSATPPASIPPSPRPASAVGDPYFRTPWEIERERVEQQRLRAQREKEAETKGWALYGSSKYDHIDGEYAIGPEKSAQFGFTAEDVARAASVRKWHPYWKAGLSSFVYHYTDLLDAEGNLIAQQSEWEDVRD
ncbi:MAG TPA: hypothetical protein VFY90_15000 [Tepidiformaceae bacterium]|nr:hypothetical protein [Tepidiformaceae bacterium]